MRQLQKIFLALAGSLIALACARPLLAEERTAYSDVLFLDQGWSEEDRLLYYNVSQGSAAMSYDIFLNLEVPDSQTLFRADENMARYGLLPQPSDPKYNPDGLPIGVSKTVVNDGRWKGEWVGLGCAACHNGQLEYKGTKIRISGGNANTLDILGFIQGLDDALAATVADPEKFTRLAEKLGKNDNPARKGYADACNRTRRRSIGTGAGRRSHPSSLVRDAWTRSASSTIKCNRTQWAFQRIGEQRLHRSSRRSAGTCRSRPGRSGAAY